MQLTTREAGGRTELIAAGLLGGAVVTALAAFAVGRNDATVRTAVLLCVTNLVTALTSIAATLLVGKPSTTHQVNSKGAARLRTEESQTAVAQPAERPIDQNTKDNQEKTQA